VIRLSFLLRTANGINRLLERLYTTRFGSWTYDGFQLDLAESNLVDLSGYDSNCIGVINWWSRKNQNYYECCPEPYVDVEITLQLGSTK